MAIAPLLDIEEIDGVDELGRVVGIAGGIAGRSSDLDIPWPRPVLRTVRDAPTGTVRDAPRCTVRDAPRCTVRDRPRPAEGRGPAGGRGEDVAARRRLRGRARRRAVLLAVVVAALVAGLSLPVRALGGTPVSPHVPRSARLAGAAVYVVQPGDTLWSIAERFDRGGNPRPMAEALARETGSATVVPGERIPIP